MDKSSFVINEVAFQWEKAKNNLISLLDNGFALAILAAMAASSKAVIVKLLYLENAINPLDLLLVRLLIALPFFILLAYWPTKCSPSNAILANHIPTNLGTSVLVFWLGFTGYYFASLTDFIGLTYISAGLERLVLFTYPTMVLAIDAIWNKRLPSKRTLLGVLLCYLGLVAAFANDLSQSPQNADIWKGIGWVMLSGISFAFYYLATSKAVKYLDVKKLTGLAGIVAFTCTLVHFLIVGDWSSLESLTVRAWVLIGIIAIVCTLLPSLLLAAAVKKIGAGLTANIGALGPILTILIAWWILGESLSGLQFIGMGLVICGIHRMK